MNTADFFNLFLIISAIHGFAFCLIMFFSKFGKHKSMIFLNLLLLSISLNNFQSWLYSSNILINENTINYFEVPWHFLGAPFFYTFLIHYLDIDKKSFKILKITIPVFFLLIITQLSFVLYFKDTLNLKDLGFLYEKYRSLEEILSFTSSVGIFSYSFYILYKKENLFPKILTFDNLKWIYNFFKLIVFVYLFWVFAIIIKFSLNFSGFLFSYYPLRIFTTIIIYLLGYQGLKYLRIHKERKLIRKNITPLIPPTKKENNSSEKKITQTKPNTKEKFNQVDLFIRKNKKYLQTKYTLQNLSKDIGIGTSTLSVIINNNANLSFIDYINNMRIEQAKKLLIDTRYSDYTIVSIGLESGFNSKSTFYNVFKKHVGCTPLAYKDSK